MGFLFCLNHDDLVYFSSLAKIQHLMTYVSVIFGELTKENNLNRMSTGHHNSPHPMEESSMTKKVVPQRLLVNTQSETYVTTMFTIQKGAALRHFNVMVMNLLT